jgi:hypothetical protein
MDHWKVIRKHASAGSMAPGAPASIPGEVRYVYTVENTETGEEKQVIATADYDLGYLISDWDYCDHEYI